MHKRNPLELPCVPVVQQAETISKLVHALEIDIVANEELDEVIERIEYCKSHTDEMNKRLDYLLAQAKSTKSKG
jgi:uncharacterized coiled-coil DUF342 family protein